MIRNEFYLSRAMEDILYGKEGILPGKFKEHLIFDEQFEFLKRFVDTNDA